jgi:hypothetical protein
VPGIWGVAIVPPGITGIEDAAFEKPKALLLKLAPQPQSAPLMVGQERKSKRHQNPGARST